LQVGDAAPEIELKTHAGADWKLSAFRGKKNVVLAFYPFAFSPTCTSQIPGLEDHLDRFTDRETEVAALSVDHRYANAAWAESLGGIRFPLLSDFYPHGAVAQRYGILRKEGMAERAVFIIDKSGTIRYIDVHKINEAPDEEQILDELRNIS
jgi:peroxiredoxin (alkyl hydroperoxide reductase subunit C)